MFVYYSCKCGNAYKVNKTDKDLGLLTLRMRCPADYSKCSGLEIQDSDNAEGVHFTARELFTLCSGRGTEKERQCSPYALRDLLIGGRINDIQLAVSNSDPNRSIIDTMLIGIDFASEKSRGVAVYFATSTQGATIYKIIEL